MRSRFDLAGHLYIVLTLAFTVYGQLVIKWQVGQEGEMPVDGPGKFLFLLRQFLNPWILSDSPQRCWRRWPGWRP